MIPKKYALIIATFSICSLTAMDKNLEQKDPWETKVTELTKADKETQEKTRSTLVAENKLLLFKLGHRLDHDDLVQAAKPLPLTQRIVSKDNSTVVTLPEAAHHIALNHDGTAVAIAYGNKLKVLQKKQGWGDDVYENTYPLPLNGIAFSGNDMLVCAHNKGFYQLALKTKDLTLLPRDTAALLSTISPNGKWRFTEETNGDKISCVLVDLTKKFEFPLNLSPAVTQIKRFAADAAGENFIFASDSKIVIMYLKVQDNTYKTKAIEINPDLQNIADIDISPDGNHRFLASDGTMTYLIKTSDDTISVRFRNEAPFSINAARISPWNNNNLILGTNIGIVLFDRTKNSCFKLFSPANKSVQSVAISSDGNTIAAGTENGAYIINIKKTEHSISALELLLIKRLEDEPSEKVFSSPTFVNIFKNFSNPTIKQNLVKTFSIDYKKLGYEECPICNDNFANIQTHCKHNFCSDCLDRIKEVKQPCPLCRSKIENA